MKDKSQWICSKDIGELCAPSAATHLSTKLQDKCGIKSEKDGGIKTGRIQREK